jgi:hypothetical protein
MDGKYESNSAPFTTLSVYFLFAAIGLNLVLNIMNLIFFRKYIFSNEKYKKMYVSISKKSLLGKCMQYQNYIFSIVITHKLTEILFSNLFASKYHMYKVSNISIFTPLNVIRYVSALPSILAIVGASFINYEHQSIGLTSSLFIQSIDCIIVTIFSFIITIWVTNRKEQDYE